MELNEEQLNRLMSLMDTKIDAGVTTKLATYLPDTTGIQPTVFEQVYMKGYTCGMPLQQQVFRAFLHKCHFDTMRLLNILTVANVNTIFGYYPTHHSNVFTTSMLSGQSLHEYDLLVRNYVNALLANYQTHTEAANQPSVAFKDIITDNGTKTAQTKADSLTIKGTNGITVIINSNGEINVDSSALPRIAFNSVKADDNSIKVAPSASSRLDVKGSGMISTFISVGGGALMIDGSALKDLIGDLTGLWGTFSSVAEALDNLNQRLKQLE